MRTFKEFKEYLEEKGRCWSGYKPVSGKKPYSKGSCVKEEELEEIAQPTGKLKKACWTGYTAVGTKEKNGRTVPNCVPTKEEVELEEAKHYPYKFRATYHDPDTNEVTHYFDFTHRNLDAAKKHAQGSRLERKDGKQDKLHSVVQMKEEYDVEELFDILEEVVNGIAEEMGHIDPDIIWENLEDVSDEELYETAAWRRKEGKNPTGGLNAKGIASYRRENPGSKLSMAVTGKVKPGSKAAKRRKSFCARMGGMPGAMKKPNGEPTRKALALRKWKCR
jgi:hypothetical protein